MFRLTIRTENDAFSPPDAGPELARILRRLAGQLDALPLDGTTGGRVLDVNGNVVGEWEYRP